MEIHGVLVLIVFTLALKTYCSVKGCLIYKFWLAFFSQSFEFSGKKPNKIPVKENGPAGKPSGSAVRPQTKVGKALSPAQFYCLVVNYLKN